MIILAPFLAVAAAAGKPVLVSSPASLALLAYLGVATMALSYGLLYAGMRTTSGSAAPSPRSSSRLSAAILAALLLDERMTLRAFVGGSLILAAVVALRPTEDRSAPA